ncbi:hypothetical protein MalM25_25010 [Planctomycetes bacterium MalM25]|nr:hypothetical protein MalM25_25010 [Planctomycetes bacterium MalM25]
MRFSFLIVVAVTLGSTVASVATPPDRLDQYRLLPSHSVLTQSGGFAGVETRYRLRGEYDFLREWSGGTPNEPLELTPRFDNVDIRAPLGPLLPAFIDVGHLFNMELLTGELIPQPFAFTPFEVYRFEGIANDSPAASPLEQSLVEMYAVTLGPWMYLRGETIPRDWVADYFEYDLRALARSGDWSDYNEDGVVDASDYTSIRDTASMLAAPSDQWLIEASAKWRGHYGDRAPALALFDNAIEVALSQQGGATAVPEPTALVLLVVAALTPGLGSRRSLYRL